jgi:hypothetical protein
MDAPRHREMRGLNARVPWLTAEDAWILSTLTAEQARAFEPLLHQQARSDLRHHTHTVSLDVVAGIAA